MNGEPQSRRGRHRFAGLVALSITGVGLVAWRYVDDMRSWWEFGAGVLAAVIGVVLGSKGRRAPPGPDGRHG